jgi:hypothetical protein
VAAHDLESSPPPEVLGRQSDTIVAVNVIEHVRDEGERWSACASACGRAAGSASACQRVLRVRAMDVGLGHHPRDTAASLGDLLTRPGFAFAAPR